MTKRHDLAIVGGGTAGLVAAVGAAGIGARVVLVERERTGGDCLWTGCVPSKALLAAAKVAASARRAEEFGIRIGKVEVDFPAVMAHVRASQEIIQHHDSEERLASLGVDVMHGTGRFLDAHTLDVDGVAVPFRRALLATGARPSVPPVDGLVVERVVTSDSVWTLDVLPPRLTVIGGGAIGVELGQAFARLGSDVTLVEMQDRLVPNEEPEAAAAVQRALTRDGVTVLTGARVLQLLPADTGRAGTLRIQIADGVEIEVAHDVVLVATGRGPNTVGLGLDDLAVARTPSGHVIVDQTMRTSARTIFAAGDVTTRAPFTHVAGMDASVVVANALFGLRRKVADRLVWATFTDPEVGRVGDSLAEAVERFGEGASSHLYDHANLDRAITERHTDGFTKLVADPHGRIVGGTVVGPTGGEAAATIDAWIRADAKVGDVGQAMHAYPTHAEGIQRVGVEHLRTSLLTPRVRKVLRPVLGMARGIDRLRR